MKATAKQIVYLISAEQLSMTGGVVIDQPRGSMRGETIKYDLKTGRMTAGGDGSRIQMRLEPKPEVKPKAKPAAKSTDKTQVKP
jgi:lipopolysaccharide export system protein LptA